MNHQAQCGYIDVCSSTITCRQHCSSAIATSMCCSHWAVLSNQRVNLFVGLSHIACSATCQLFNSSIIKLAQVFFCFCLNDDCLFSEINFIFTLHLVGLMPMVVFIVYGRAWEQWICIMCIQVNLPHCTKSRGRPRFGGQNKFPLIQSENRSQDIFIGPLWTNMSLSLVPKGEPFAISPKSIYVSACNSTKRSCQLWTL